MKNGLLAGLCVLALLGCQRSPSEVVDKVLVDFGVHDQPEGTETGSGKVSDRLAQVGKVEIKRLNLETREGTVEFQEGEGLEGKYYKQVKVYESARPLDAEAVSRTGSSDERGYVGYIDYVFRIYESERRNTRVEAAALDADIRTSKTGRERYRYNFTPAGTWDNAEGQRVKQ